MIEVKPLQPAKAEFPIEVTVLGSVIEVKPLQPAKAEFPIVFTPSGSVIEVKPLQPEKADSPIEVASFIVSVVKDGFFASN